MGYGLGISPGEVLSSHRLVVLEQMLSDDAQERCIVCVGGTGDQDGFGHHTHQVLEGTVQPYILYAAGNGEGNG